ncbi:MAG: hypothetical protein WBW73_14420, partial [Rhodoplanes sp.]
MTQFEKTSGRHAFIGGSDARIIMGDDEPALLRLWREKRGEIEPEAPLHLAPRCTIPCFVPKADAAEGELMTIKRAAIALGVAPSTIHRLLNDGIIAGEQITPGAP